MAFPILGAIQAMISGQPQDDGAIPFVQKNSVNQEAINRRLEVKRNDAGLAQLGLEQLMGSGKKKNPAQPTPPEQELE